MAALAERYRIGVDAVKSMLEAVANGGGGMAQFNIPELGGGGQWMRGGMTMVGDMFNSQLKATVENLCSELATVLTSQQALFAPAASYQSQSQSHQSQSQGGGGAGSSWQQPWAQPSSWWPDGFGAPSSTGAQNNVRYAYFPASNRLAIESGGRVSVYDTKGHTITGFGQQQGGGASLTFTSQHGIVAVDRLPPVGVASAATPHAPQGEAASVRPAGGDGAQVFALIEQLGQLKEKGLLTEEEFATKKTEILKRV